MGDSKGYYSGGAFHEATPEELQARRESRQERKELAEKTREWAGLYGPKVEGKYDYLTGATQGAGYKANLELKKKINAFVFGEKKRSGGREKPQWVKAYWKSGSRHSRQVFCKQKRLEPRS